MPNTSRPYTPPERDVQKAVLAIGRAMGYRLQRRNTGGVAAAYKGRSRFVRFGTPGDSDLYGQATVGPNRGIMVALEVKRLGKRPSPAQVASLRATIEAGGIALWVDSAELAYRMLAAILAGATVEIDEDGNQHLCREGDAS